MIIKNFFLTTNLKGIPKAPISSRNGFYTQRWAKSCTNHPSSCHPVELSTLPTIGQQLPLIKPAWQLLILIKCNTTSYANCLTVCVKIWLTYLIIIHDYTIHLFICFLFVQEYGSSMCRAQTSSRALDDGPKTREAQWVWSLRQEGIKG